MSSWASQDEGVLDSIESSLLESTLCNVFDDSVIEEIDGSKEANDGVLLLDAKLLIFERKKTKWWFSMFFFKKISNKLITS